MRYRLALAACLLLTQSAWGAEVIRPYKLRLADAAADACLAGCDNQNAACRRVCPATLSTPCFMSCDSQAQTCRQACRSK